MKIVNHRLVQEPHDSVQIVHREPFWRAQIVPEVIVIHYGVTHKLASLVAAQAATGYWAHLSIDGWQDGDGSSMLITQALQFNRRGSHAGKSSFEGRDGLNAYSVGIEICNPGPLVKGKDGLLRTVYKNNPMVWDPEDAIETGPIPGYPKAWTYWAKYSLEEMAICAAVCHALRQEYPIRAIVGHSEVSPGRKFDPGPAFDMAWLRGFVFPKELTNE